MNKKEEQAFLKERKIANWQYQQWKLYRSIKGKYGFDEWKKIMGYT